MNRESMAALIKEVQSRIEEQEGCREQADYDGNGELASYCAGAAQSLQWVLNQLEEIKEESS